jgi:two-component system, chemotaxis family, CheB/CheR fusion protein
MAISQLGATAAPPSVVPYLFLPPDLQPENQVTSTADQEHEEERKRRALIVDDVADVTAMLKVALMKAGYDVVIAHSADKALKAAKKDKFDLIISDIGMPEMNGYELAKALRAMPGYEEIPMVAVTGYSMFNDREQSLRSGFTAHVTKPIDPRALLNLIDQL